MSDDLLVTRVRSRSTGIPGRCIASARQNHFVVDEPAFGGGPGEAVTPGEAFLGAVAACGVLLVESFARKDGAAIAGVEASIEGVRAKDDPSKFLRVTLRFEVRGASQAQAEALVEKFKGR